MPYSCLRAALKRLQTPKVPLKTNSTAYRPLATTAYTMTAAASNSTPNAFTAPVNKTAHEFDKATLDAMLTRRFFFTPAFEIYGGK